MPAIIPAAMVAGSVVSGAMGSAKAGADRDAANAARQQAVQQFLDIHVPDPIQQAIILKHYQQTGTLTPELEQKFQQQQSELKNISLDPTGRSAELQALAKMQEVGNANGLDAQSRAKIQAAIDSTNSNEKSQRDAIVQNFAARGMGGSGAEMQAQLLASQADANRASQQGMQASADAEQRALQAMMNSSTIGSSVRSQDYTQAAEAAKAQDLINQFNTRNSQAVAGANTDRTNAANQFNLTNQQRIAEQNVGLDNQQETFNKGLIQQKYNNELSRASGASGQYSGVAQQANNNADRTAATWSGIGSAIAQGAGAVGQNMNNDKQLDAYNARTKAQYGSPSDSSGEGYDDKTDEEK